jgi:hypothetical protein
MTPWIPVSERLPPVEQKVEGKWDDYHEPWTMVWTGEFWIDGPTRIPTPTYWRELE